MKKNPLSILILTAAGLLLAACGVVSARAGSAGSTNAAPLGQTSGPGRTLSVNGTGTIRLAPDLAYVTFGVRTQDLDVRTAVDQNSEQTQALIDVLRDAGIAEEDIQTTNFNIYSFEDYSEPFTEAPPTMYSAENSVSVTVRDLDTLGELISDAVGAGANNIWGIQFDVADRSEALSQAREAAVAEARAHADELAGLVGVELGEVINVSSMGGFPMPFPAMGVGGGGDMLESAAAVPVSPGLIQVSVGVTMVFEIR